MRLYADNDALMKGKGCGTIGPRTENAKRGFSWMFCVKVLHDQKLD
jgi:hypothetical protein